MPTMTLDEKIGRASGRFVVVAGEQVLDSDNRFPVALSEAEVEEQDHHGVVIVDRWLEEGAAGIVWRGAA